MPYLPAKDNQVEFDKVELALLYFFLLIKAMLTCLAMRRLAYLLNCLKLLLIASASERDLLHVSVLRGVL